MTQILVIDDEAIIRRALRRTLEKAGYEVLEAKDGKTAIRLCQDQSIDLALIDVLMPEKDGIEMIQELRTTFPHIKIIAISGCGQTRYFDFLTSAEDFGAHRTLHKPFENQELLEAVRAVLVDGSC